jgi:hypothetical protein
MKTEIGEEKSEIIKFKNLISKMGDDEINFIKKNPLLILKKIYDRIGNLKFDEGGLMFEKNDFSSKNLYPGYWIDFKDNSRFSLNFYGVEGENFDKGCFNPLQLKVRIQIDLLISKKSLFKKKKSLYVDFEFEPFRNFYDVVKSRFDDEDLKLHNMLKENDFVECRNIEKGMGWSTKFYKLTLDDIIQTTDLGIVLGGGNRYRIERPLKGFSIFHFSIDGFKKLEEDKRNQGHFKENFGLIKFKYYNLVIREIRECLEVDLKQELIKTNQTKSEVKNIILSEFDKDNNGKLDILEGDNLLMDLIEENQSLIVSFDHLLIKNLIKLNKLLITKKNNLSKVFEILKSVEHQNDLNDILTILRQGIENYQLLLFHSINMVVCIKEKNLIVYYELYETFDELGVFNSTWENEMSEKLSNIDLKLSTVISTLKDVIFSFKSMEQSVTNKFDQLTYITKSSFEKLNKSVNKELKSIRSGVQLNNLMTGFQSYQMYKMNKNTKSLK